MKKAFPQLTPAPVRYAPMGIDERRALLPRHSICSLAPAAKFDDAFITGNGRMRLDLLGDPSHEQMTYIHELAHEVKWASTPLPPDFNGIMPEVRRLMREDRLLDAAELVHEEQARQGVVLDAGRSSAAHGLSPLQPLRRHTAMWLDIEQPVGGGVADYLRWLDMHSGEITVRWSEDGADYSRGSFVSFADNAIYHRFTAPAGRLNLTLRLTMPTKRGDGYHKGHMNAPEKCIFDTALSDNMLRFGCAYNPEFGSKGYTICMRIVRKGGSIEVLDDGIRLTGADSLLLITAIDKYEADYSFALTEAAAARLDALPANYEAALAANRTLLTDKMERSELAFGDGDGWALSAEELLRRQHTCAEFDSMLLEKLFDMGRFFQIADTGEIPPAWGQHNINTNLQVCAGNMTGLEEEMDVYFRFYESKFDDFRVNAQRLFGARGLLASIHCDYDSGLLYHSSRTYPHYFWVGCLGWIYNELWGHYLVTGDREFLRERVIPALKEIALFFEDYARDRDEGGKSIFYPSFSPENPTPDYYTPDGVYAMSINSLMDVMICREVLQNLIDGCNELGIEQDSIAHWQEQLDLLPDYLLDEEGGLKEWAWPTIGENYNHRHVSHHYDVWPGHYVTWEDTPELAQAILISNRKRGAQNDSAHGVIHRLFTAIRLKDTDDAVHNLRQLMDHGFVTNTLNTYHYPYSTHCPDLLGAMPAILAEMAVYSDVGVVELLPAMPASLSKGRLSALRLFTFARVDDLEWDRAAGRITCRLTSLRDQKLCLRYRYGLKSITADGTALAIDGDHAELTFAAGQTVQLELAI